MKKLYKEFFEMFAARFNSEEPTMGSASLPSLRRFMTDEDIFENDDMWLYHTKDQGTPKVPNVYFTDNFAFKVLGEPTDKNDKLFKRKYGQYEWVRITMENMRRNKGYCNGEIYWMWSDCWPSAMGWTFVDYYCQPKASFYSFKKAAAPILLSITKKDENYNLYLISDEKAGVTGELTLYTLSQSGVKEISKEVISAPPMVSTVVKSVSKSTLGENEVMLAELNVDGKIYRTFYREGNLPIIPCDEVKITKQTENTITLTAKKYLHAVELEGEYVFDDNYFSMLPGESKTLTFKKARLHQNDSITLTAYTLKF